MAYFHKYGRIGVISHFASSAIQGCWNPQEMKMMWRPKQYIDVISARRTNGNSFAYNTTRDHRFFSKRSSCTLSFRRFRRVSKYGYRDYTPGMGRWTTKDFANENVYSQIQNIVENDQANQHSRFVILGTAKPGRPKQPEPYPPPRRDQPPPNHKPPVVPNEPPQLPPVDRNPGAPAIGACAAAAGVGGVILDWWTFILSREQAVMKGAKLCACTRPQTTPDPVPDHPMFCSPKKYGCCVMDIYREGSAPNARYYLRRAYVVEQECSTVPAETLDPVGRTSDPQLEPW